MDDTEDPSAVFREESRFWIQRVVVPILVSLGAAGNIVSIIVLTRRRMRSSTNVYLTGLAVADVIYLLFILVLSFRHYPNIQDRKYELYWRFFGISHWFADAASYTSVWLTVSFTIERYIVVCHPIKGKALSTEGRAKSIIAIVSILCLVATATTPFEYQLTFKDYCIKTCDEENISQMRRSNGTQTYEELMQINASGNHGFSLISEEDSNCSEHYQSFVKEDAVPVNEESLMVFTNSTQKLLETIVNIIFLNTTCCAKNYTINNEYTNLGKNLTYQSIFYWFSSIVFAVLPLAMIATFNCFLIKAVYKYHKRRKRMTNTQEKMSQVQENRITLLLISIVVLFLICQIPWAAFLIYCTLDNGSDTYSENIKRGLGNIFNSLLTLNASCNFILYCALSDRFRRTFKTTFCSHSNLNREDTFTSNGRSMRTLKAKSSSRRPILKRKDTDCAPCTPRNLEAYSLNSIPKAKSLMQRPLGKAKVGDLIV